MRIIAIKLRTTPITCLIEKASLKIIAEEIAIAITFNDVINAENLPIPILVRGRLKSKRDIIRKNKPVKIAGVITKLNQTLKFQISIVPNWFTPN